MFSKGGRITFGRVAILSILIGLCLMVVPWSVSAEGTVTTLSGTPIENATVQLVEYPQYNDTTDAAGNYSILNVPYGTYTISASAAGYSINVSTVTVDALTIIKDFILTRGYNYIASGQVYDAPRGGQWKTNFVVGNLGSQPTLLNVTFLNVSGVVKNSSADIISEFTSIDYIWSDWVTNVTGDTDGSATINSEQPVDIISMQRSNRVGKLGFFDGAPLNTGNTEWLVPGLIYDAPRGGQWRSGFKVLNLGDVDADVTMNFYDSRGIQVNTITTTIAPKTSPYYDWYTYGYLASGSSTYAMDGTATVTSTNAQPLNIVASQASEARGKLGFWNGINLNEQKTEIFATGLTYDAPRGGQWRSGFKVANMGSTDANVNIYFYNSVGTQINLITVNIPPKSSPYYDWYTYGYLASGSSTLAMDGTARIVSTNSMPLYVVESQASEVTGILDFYGAKEINGNSTAGLIYLKYQNGERSGFKIANPSQTSPVSVTIRFYNETGVLVNTVTGNVDAKSSPYYAWNTYTSAPYGTVTVEATGRISVTESIASETEGKLGIFKGIME